MKGRYDAQALDVLINTNNTFIGFTPLQSGIHVSGEIRNIKKNKNHTPPNNIYYRKK